MQKYTVESGHSVCYLHHQTNEDPMSQNVSQKISSIFAKVHCTRPGLHTFLSYPLSVNNQASKIPYSRTEGTTADSRVGTPTRQPSSSTTKKNNQKRKICAIRAYPLPARGVDVSGRNPDEKKERPLSAKDLLKV